MIFSHNTVMKTVRLCGGFGARASTLTALWLCGHLIFKGITSRIGRLICKHLKVGPSSPVSNLPVVPGVYDLAPGYMFLQSPAPHTLRALIGWGLHTTAQRVMPRNVPNATKFQAESRVSTDTDTATHS